MMSSLNYQLVMLLQLCSLEEGVCLCVQHTPSRQYGENTYTRNVPESSSDGHKSAVQNMKKVSQ